MNKLFTIYGMAILLLFGTATHRGYNIGSLFARSHHVGANGNHYHK